MAANISRLTKDDRRTELLRAAEVATLEDRVTRLEAGPRFQWQSNWVAATPVTSFTAMNPSTPPSLNVGFVVPGSGLPLAPVAGMYAMTSLLPTDRDSGRCILVVKIDGNQISNILYTTTKEVRGLSVSVVGYLSAGSTFTLEALAAVGCIMGGAGSVVTMSSLF